MTDNEPLARARALAAEGRADEALAALRPHAADPACNDRLREMLLGERRVPEAMAILHAAPEPPGAPRTHVIAAIEKHLRGDFAGAVDACRAALAIAPDDPTALNHLGRALFNAGRAEAALATFDKAVQADPAYPEAWHNLGHCLRAVGQLGPACDAFRHALQLSPGYRSARVNLGITLFAEEQAEASLACFDALLERNFDDVEALVNAGLALRLLGRLGQARQRFERAVELQPDHALAHFSLGALLNELSEPEAAERSLRRSLQLDPRDPDAWAELAGLHELSGDIEQATGAVQQGLALMPAHPLLNIEAAKLERRRGDPLAAEARLRRLDPARLPQRLRQMFLYELGTVLDHNQQTDAAWRAFEQANAIAARSVRRKDIDGETFFRDVAAIRSWLDAGAPGMNSRDDDPDDGADLCFLVGFPRSGTTLLDTVLAASPALSAVEERPTLEPVVATLAKVTGGYPAAIGELDAADRSMLRRMYRDALTRHGALPGRRILDKLPLRTIHLGLVQALFPRARVLFAQRHPCDVVLSNVMQQYAVNAAVVNFYTLADAVRMYDAVFSLWRGSLQPRLALPVHTVRYEDLVADPATVAAAAYGFLGLDWDPAALDTASRGRDRERVRTNSYQQVAEPIYRRADGRWRRYREQLAPFLPLLAPHCAAMGYRLD